LLYWEATNPERGYEAYYPNHLGRLGLVQVIDNTQTALIIVSEWGEEFSGFIKKGEDKKVSIRKRVCEIFQASFPDRRIIAADIGLSTKLSGDQVMIRVDATASPDDANDSGHWSVFEDIDYSEDNEGRLTYREIV